MKDYDTIVVGGGIAGSITAEYAAQGGLSILLIEKEKTPREKPCSGIQFPCFERILGEWQTVYARFKNAEFYEKAF